MSLHGEGATKLSSFYQDTNLIHEASTLMIDDLPEAPPPWTTTLETGFTQMRSVGHRHPDRASVHTHIRTNMFIETEFMFFRNM